MLDMSVFLPPRGNLTSADVHVQHRHEWSPSSYEPHNEFCAGQPWYCTTGIDLLQHFLCVPHYWKRQFDWDHSAAAEWLQCTHMLCYLKEPATLTIWDQMHQIDELVSWISGRDEKQLSGHMPSHNIIKVSLKETLVHSWTQRNVSSECCAWERRLTASF